MRVANQLLALGARRQLDRLNHLDTERFDDGFHAAILFAEEAWIHT
jgi:hypothetical protein